MQNHKKRNLLLLFMIGRLSFIFFDAVINKNKEAENIVYFKNIGVDIKNTKENKTNTNEEIFMRESLENEIEKKLQNQQINNQNLNTLIYLYKKEKDPNLLKEIIKKQAQNYNFNEAWENIQELLEKNENIDIHLIFYVFLNSNNIRITQKDSINNILPILDKAVQNNQIGSQDYSFYAGIIEIWNKNYKKGLEQRKQIKTPHYQPIIQSFQAAINSYDPSKAIPQYYQDGLVALAALKNGYFNIARKISLEILLQDENYILPYQILSYAHFLTNNRDTAIEYFLKLVNFDKKNQTSYQFLIGISYYWKNDYTSSILYLSQIENNKFQTDSIRYLILNYLEIDEHKKTIESRQKLLGQNDIRKSDFFLYFNEVFYKAYFSQNKILYETNKYLATMFIEECEKKLKNDDVCIFGKIGYEIINNQLSNEKENILKNLAKEYNQSYLYHILGDFDSKKGATESAKERYAKTIATSQDSREINFVQKKLINFEN